MLQLWCLGVLACLGTLVALIVVMFLVLVGTTLWREIKDVWRGR